MKKLTLLSVASLLVIGCGAEPARPVAVAPPTEVETRTASALAFDPPITRQEGTPDLSRDQRGASALVGFEEAQTSVSDVVTYNRQASDFSNYYDKEAVSEKSITVRR